MIKRWGKRSMDPTHNFQKRFRGRSRLFSRRGEAISDRSQRDADEDEIRKIQNDAGR
jgi:hypothetical protein